MRITSIGEILIDMTQTEIDKTGVVHFAANPGGAPANVAVAAAKLGADSAFIGCVGNDSFGAILSSTLSRFGVNTDGLQVTDRASTTLAIVRVDEKGERSFSFCRNPGADTRIDREKACAAAAETDILHFGSVSLTDPDCRETIYAAINAAKENGAVVTYDPNYRAPLWKSEKEAIAEMRKALPLCDIVKISDEECEMLTGHSEPDDAAKALCGSGVRLALVTLGAGGAIWRFGEESGFVPGFPVKVADTNGAGDTFFGAFLTKFAGIGGFSALSRAKLDEFVRFANRAASVTVSRPGAIPAMPTKQELEAL